MANVMDVFKCEVCGSIVEVLHDGSSPSCCGKEMTLLAAKVKEEGTEKHMPVLEKTSHGYNVKVGSVPHPMLPEHHIEWVELIVDDRVLRKNLVPGNAPEAEFCVPGKPKKVWARAYCNVHGLWKSA